ILRRASCRDPSARKRYCRGPHCVEMPGCRDCSHFTASTCGIVSIKGIRCSCSNYRMPDCVHLLRTTTMPRLPTRSQAYEASEDIGRNPSNNLTIGDVIAARYDRRDLIRGALGVAAIAATASPLALAATGRADAQSAPSPRYVFKELEAGSDQTHHVAEGYDADVLIRWGDPVLPNAPTFDPHAQTGAAQRQQFGYNNDYLAYFPMPGAANPSHH